MACDRLHLNDITRAERSGQSNRAVFPHIAIVVHVSPDHGSVRFHIVALLNHVETCIARAVHVVPELEASQRRIVEDGRNEKSRVVSSCWRRGFEIQISAKRRAQCVVNCRSCVYGWRRAPISHPFDLRSFLRVLPRTRVLFEIAITQRFALFLFELVIVDGYVAFERSNCAFNQNVEISGCGRNKVYLCDVPFNLIFIHSFKYSIQSIAQCLIYHSSP